MKKKLFQYRSNSKMVKEAFDNLPNGICFFDKNGMPVMCNRQMHRLCFELFGFDLQSMMELASALRELPSNSRAVKKDDLYLLADGTAWRFTMQNVADSQGNTYTEYIAADVTQLHNVKAELEESNREQEENLQRIANFYQNIAMIIRNEEILKMKMKIHNELGEILHVTNHFLEEGCPSDEKADFAMLQIKMAKVLLGEVESEKEPNPFELLNNIASAMGMEIVTEGTMPENEALRTMLSYAVRECLTNTVRHAGGDKVYMNLTANSDNLMVVLTNNGMPPETEITEGGGLTSLRVKIQRACGSMEIVSLPKFMMKITLPLDLK